MMNLAMGPSSANIPVQLKIARSLVKLRMKPQTTEGRMLWPRR